MKKLIAIILAMLMVAVLVAACGNNDPPAPATPTPTPEATAPAADGPSYIAVISKGFQHQFWQAVYQGARDAGAYYGVQVSFDGPESEADIGPQLDMLRGALARNPDAIAFAALDTDAALAELADAYARNIPVVGFDSGIPDAPPGQVRATAATNNIGAGALAADHMFPEIQSALAAATEASPVVVAVLSQDATSESVTGRTQGFAERMYALAGGVNDSVAITGGLARINTGNANSAINIQVVVGATPSTVDMTSAAHGVLTTPNLLGVFCSNEGAVVGLLSTINAGTAVPAGVILTGFDAGAMQKAAVESGLMFGSVTQDPVQIGFQSVSLAVRAARGETVSDIDTGARWWNAENMHDPEIAILLYD